MAQKAVAMQFIVVVRSRPNDATAASEAGPTYSSADDTGLIARSGTYNRPPNPGETVFTSERAAFSAGLSLNATMQRGLGQNARTTVYGKPCGTVPNNATRALTNAELEERVYISGDSVSPGLRDAIKYANQVPNAGGIVIRSEAGPEVDITDEKASNL